MEARLLREPKCRPVCPAVDSAVLCFVVSWPCSPFLPPTPHPSRGSPEFLRGTQRNSQNYTSNVSKLGKNLSKGHSRGRNVAQRAGGKITKMGPCEIVGFPFTPRFLIMLLARSLPPTAPTNPLSTSASQGPPRPLHPFHPSPTKHLFSD